MKTLTGTITSNKMEKTVVVNVERLWQHPVYKKRVKRSTKISAHTDKPLKEGQTVTIAETTPISKTKRWKVVEVIKK
jgi:small subunit ribosomal protein S17